MFGDVGTDTSSYPSPATAAPQSSNADIFAMPANEPIGNELDSMFGGDESLLENNETGIFTMTMGNEPTGSDIENQLDSIFGNSAPASPHAPAQAQPASEIIGEGAFKPAMGEPSGDDIGDRLDFMFAEPDSVSGATGSGEQDMVFFDSGMGMTNNSATPPASSIPTITEDDFTDGEPSGDDIENRLSSLFGGEAFQTSLDDNDPILSNEQYDISAIIAEELNASGNDIASDTAEEQDVSGDDISSRIDDLFAQHGDGSVAPDFSSFEAADSGQALSEENDSALFDFNYTETVDSEINNLIASAQDSPQSSPQDLAQNLTEDSPQNLMPDNKQNLVEDYIQGFMQDNSITADSFQDIVHDTIIDDDSIENSTDMLSEPQQQADNSIFDSPENSEQTAVEPTAQSASNPDEVSGDDIEARLKDLFNDTGAASSALPEESAVKFEEPLPGQSLDDSIFSSDEKTFHNENVFTNELIDAGNTEHNLIDTAEQEYAINGDDVQEKIRQLFKSGVSETETIDLGTSFGENEIDERDAAAALELPDHVLTPTLADIYFQQGQPKLSLQIYERLALRDPKDPRLQSKIQEIKDFLGSEAGDESTKKKTR
jgi:hypothetical protein